jgi:nascent polypeptide-associated complex subunit alpha
MFGAMSSRQMEKMMKQMGIKSENIAAEEVVIKAKNKEIIISNPQVTKINMSGQDTFQVVGEVSEKAVSKITDEDVKMVAEQTGKSEEEARKVLEETNDIAEAILKLKE